MIPVNLPASTGQAIGRYRSSCRMVPSDRLASTIHPGDVYLV